MLGYLTDNAYFYRCNCNFVITLKGIIHGY